MYNRLSETSKRKRGMGAGEGADYKPFILPSEFNSLGTTALIRDWKTGRMVSCLSQAEALWYYELRWQDKNLDIREQFPMDMSLVKEVCEQFGLAQPCPNRTMTTDFLITEEGGHYHAYSVKADRNLKDKELQKLCIEKLYWQSMECEYDILFKTDANKTLASNVRIVTQYYDPESITEQDEYSLIKHLLATKQIKVDMEHEVISNIMLKKLKEKYRV